MATESQSRRAAALHCLRVATSIMLAHNVLHSPSAFIAAKTICDREEMQIEACTYTIN